MLLVISLFMIIIFLLVDIVFLVCVFFECILFIGWGIGGRLYVKFFLSLLFGSV